MAWSHARLRRCWSFIAAALLSASAASACTWGEGASLGLAVTSPDSAYAARSYQVGGGGAAGFVANVVDLRPAADTFEWAGWRHEAIFLSSYKYVTLRWAAPRHLIVEYGDYRGNGAGHPPSRALTTKGP